MDANLYWSVEECGWLLYPTADVVVPAQREDELVEEPVDA